MKSETRPPQGNRVLENASTVGHRFDGSKDTRSRDFRQQSAARLVHKQGSRAKRVATCLVRADVDEALRQLCINAHAAGQWLAIIASPSA